MLQVDIDGARPIESSESRWRRIANFTVILFGSGAGGLAFGVIAPVLKPMARQLGSEQLSQIIVAMPMLGLAVGSLVGAWVAERFGAKRTIGISGLALGLTGLVPLIAPLPFVLLLDCFIIGCAAAVMAIGSTLLLADRYSGDTRARVIGYSSAFGSIIAAAAAMISGVAADHFGWRAAFLQFTSAGVIIVIFTLAAVRDVRAGAREMVLPPAFSLLVPMFPFFAAGFLVYLVVLAIYTHIPLLVAAAGASSITVTSTVIIMQPVSGIGAGLVYGTLQARLGKSVVAGIALGLIVLGTALMAASHAPVLFGVACAAAGAGLGLVIPFLINMVLNTVEPSMRPRALGIFTAVGFLGGFASPFVMRPIREIVGLHGVFVVLAVATLVIGAGSFGAGSFMRGSAARIWRRPV
jgi:MFS family permease